MEIKDIQKVDKKSVVIGIRTTTPKSNWMKENKISPTKLFNEALEELMDNQK